MVIQPQSPSYIAYNAAALTVVLLAIVAAVWTKRARLKAKAKTKAKAEAEAKLSEAALRFGWETPSTKSALQLESHGKLHFHDVVHAAQHQLQHRGSEKLGFAVAEHLVERGVETLAERAIEHVAERAVEHVAERAMEQVAERAMEHMAERAVEHVAERTAEAINERLLESRYVEGRALSALRILRVAVPIAGTVLIGHMTHSDVHRAQREWRERRFASSTVLFWLAAACDALDTLAHLVVVASITCVHVDHHALHSVERASVVSAVVATVAMIIAELQSAAHAKRKRMEAASAKMGNKWAGKVVATHAGEPAKLKST